MSKFDWVLRAHGTARTCAVLAPVFVLVVAGCGGAGGTDTGPQGNADTGPQGGADTGARDLGPQGTMDTGPQGTIDTGPQGTTDTGPQGTTDVGPQATMDSGPQPDTGTADAGPRDAGPDAGLADAGPRPLSARLWLRERQTGNFFFRTQTAATTFGAQSAAIGWTADGAALGGGGTASYQPFYGDFNADSRVDIGVRERETGAIFIRTGNGSGGFAAAPTPTVTWSVDAAAGNTYQVFAADFDADGRTDIGLRERQTGSFFIRLTLAAGGFGPASAAITWTADGAPLSGGGTATYQPFAADFNGDGRAEIGVRENETGSFFVRTNQGSLTFAVQNTPSATWTGDSAANGTYQAFAADFDGDNRADIGLRELRTANFFIRLQVAGGAFAASGPAVLTWTADGTNTYQAGASSGAN